MRFKKGSRVEVVSKKEIPSGSWHRAKIICGNGHNYSVSYDRCMDIISDAVVERVPRKAIRPCPPSLSRENWLPGDIVEVLDNFSWKIATVSKVLKRKHYMVRLLGSTQEFKVHILDMRVRQHWNADKWVVIGQGSGDCAVDKYGKNIILKSNQDSSTQLRNTRMNFYVKNNGLPYKKVPESQLTSNKAPKRGLPFISSQIGEYAGTAQKLRAIEDNGRRIKVASHPFMLSKHATSMEYESSDMNIGRQKPTEVVGSSVALKLKPERDDGVESSVSSCSISRNYSYKLPSRIANLVQNNDDQVSDAESVCPLEYEEAHHLLPTKQDLLPTKQELEAEIHRLELQAYHVTMEALHASGPLSWEKETLVTNLRLLLHISNDEHLTELRQIISSSSNIPVS